MILADTSVWVEHFRFPQSKPAKELARLLRRNQVAITGVVLAEVVQGSRSPRQAEEIGKNLGALPSIEVTLGDWIRVGTISCQFREQGLTIPLADLAIAVAALKKDIALFSLDKHFERVPGLRLHAPGHAG
jgi:predicted nucleic acid-binding protein